jgi:hypothetical protein
MICLKRGADDAARVPSIRANFVTTQYTPPQVDKSKCRKTYIKASTHYHEINETSLPKQMLLYSFLPGREVFDSLRSPYFHGQRDIFNPYRLYKCIQSYTRLSGRSNRMDTQRKVDRSSPIVERVRLLRERMARQDAGTAQEHTCSAQTQNIYQWQMWQKSDPTLYFRDDAEDRGKP